MVAVMEVAVMVADEPEDVGVSGSAVVADVPDLLRVDALVARLG